MKKIKDPDIIALKLACKAIENISERMRKPTIEFLWDKYVLSSLRKKGN